LRPHGPGFCDLALIFCTSEGAVKSSFGQPAAAGAFFDPALPGVGPAVAVVEPEGALVAVEDP